MVAALIDFPRSTSFPAGRAARRPLPGAGAGDVLLASTPSTSGVPLRSKDLRAAYRRRRIVAAGLVAATLLFLLIALQAALGRSDGGPLTTIGSAGGAQPAAAHLVVVRPGDTLWGIALSTGDRGDIRPLVDRLSAEVGGRPLQPGQEILVP